jgi:hypothetical protein
LLLFSIDCLNRLAYHDLSDSASDLKFENLLDENETNSYQIVDSIENDKVSCLYMAPFLTSEESNHNHLFVGMNSGSIHIYNITKKDFTNYSIKNF